MRKLGIIIASILLFGTATVFAKPHELHIPLHDGKLRLADVSADLLEDLHLPTSHLLGGEINLNGLGGSLLISAMNRSLGDGCRLEVHCDELLLHVDADKLPKSIDSTKQAIRVFTATTAPEATAAQARQWGLLLPRKVDTNRPLVILVHGLNSDPSQWNTIGDLLKKSGQQVAYFSYPDDGPIADDAAILTRHMSAVQQTFPNLKVNIIAFSMGALVSRAYVEGPNYVGGVDHLILVAPPNHGSKWAGFSFLGKWKEHVELAIVDRHWSPTWMITSGLGEASRDLTPDSKFLDRLNAYPRRAGVRYTIVMGDEHVLRRMAADGVADAKALIPTKAADWWGVRQCRVGLALVESEIRGHKDRSDGPVTLKSAVLAGVEDVVELHADHETMIAHHGKELPAAWGTIQARLSQ